MKPVFFGCVLLLTSLTISAYEKRDILQKSFDEDKLKKSFTLNQKWIKYPDYNDRDGWDNLTGSLKQELIDKGTEYLNYNWQYIELTDYLEFGRSGNRQIMEAPYKENRSAFTHLVIAELAEGKGRFMEQIANGIWFYCEMTSWAYSAHMHHHTRAERTGMPDPNEHIIELASGDMGSFLAWTYFFLKDELNEMHPLIASYLRKNLQKRILDVYINRDDFDWQVFNATPTTKVINWTPWVSFNVLSCFLLLENDPEVLASAIYRTMISVDNFINVYQDDGACEEGPSYWKNAVGRLYDYLKILDDTGLDMAPVFKLPLIKRMGEFVSKAYIGNGWVVNYSDASARYDGPLGLIFRYGETVGSDEMKQFASYLFRQKNNNDYVVESSDFFRTIENIKSYNDLVNTPPATSQAPCTWYPQTEFLYMRDNTGFFFSAKGGTNQQGHNHNDVGSFVLFYKSKPVVIDVGVGTYTKQTFSGERYSIWTMQSNYHNLPVINGIPQRSLGGDKRPDDHNFSAREVRFDERKSTLSMDISRSYHPDSKAQSWIRRYIFKPDQGLIVEDEFRLTEAVENNQVNFMVAEKPDLTLPGRVKLNIGDEIIVLKYNDSDFEEEVETIQLTDRKLSNVWGDTLYRVSLNAKELKTKGKYKFQIYKE
jgi:hypothetical protein